MKRNEIRDECEERAFAVSDYTYGHEDREYFRPVTEHGYPDFTLMLDIMGIEPAVLYERTSRDGEKVTRALVMEVTDNHIDFMEGYDLPESGWKESHYLKSETALDEDGFPWSKVLDDNYVSPSIGERGAVRHRWQQFLEGRLEIIGHLFEV